MARTLVKQAVCKSRDSDDKSSSDEVKSRRDEMEERWLFLLFIVVEGLQISCRRTIKAKERKKKTITGVMK